MTDEIELRLRNVASTAVLRQPDERAIEKLDASSPTTGRLYATPRAIQIPSVVAAVVIAILLANVAAAYFAPRYGNALADAPGIGPISKSVLGAVGLDGGNLTTVGDSATSSGHTLKLVAAFADGLRTVFFVSIDGQGLTGNAKSYGQSQGEYGVDYNGLTLTDQFERSYGGRGIGGPTELQFEPLQWPASQVGARFTLHVTGLDAMWMRDATPIAGDWTLHATLVGTPAHVITLPANVEVAGSVFKFTGITASETEVVVHWTVAGPYNEAFGNLLLNQSRSTDPYADPLVVNYYTPRMYDEAGDVLKMQDWGFGWPKNSPVEGEMTVFIPGPGRYRIQLGAAVDARWIVVP